MTLARLTAAAGLVVYASTVFGTEPCGRVEPNVGTPPETAQFAFLIGDHEVALHAWRGDKWTPPRPVKARWRGWYGLDGRAIYDEWADPGTSANPGGHGVNVRMFDPEAQIWKMMWIATPTHQVQDLRAEVTNGVLTMWQVYPERPGWRAEFRVLDDRRWERVTYTQADDGAWTPQFRLVATRTADVADCAL